MSLSIHGLRVYPCILKCSSLSAAGRELGKMQPAVSNRLHTLEEHFGVALLTRGRPLGSVSLYTRGGFWMGSPPWRRRWPATPPRTDR
jgi:DNA-binding transcriptional LysR family regulator